MNDDENYNPIQRLITYNPMNGDAIFFIIGYIVLNGMRHNEWIETNKALTESSTESANEAMR